jgi:hypothetical protein
MSGQVLQYSFWNYLMPSYADRLSVLATKRYCSQPAAEIEAKSGEMAEGDLQSIRSDMRAADPRGCPSGE